MKNLSMEDTLTLIAFVVMGITIVAITPNTINNIKFCMSNASMYFNTNITYTLCFAISGIIESIALIYMLIVGLFLIVAINIIKSR